MKMDQAQRQRCCELEELESETLAEMVVELEAKVPEIWVLTDEYNEYDQHGSYFLAAWHNKPSLAQITSVTGEGNDTAIHILNGGGRRGVEDHWYSLFPATSPVPD